VEKRGKFRDKEEKPEKRDGIKNRKGELQRSLRVVAKGAF